MSITADITKIKNEINTKIRDELSTRDNKVTNELTACLSEIISFFTAELGKINTELNSKLTTEIEKFNVRDAGYITEVQKIFSRLNNIEEVCQNDFGRIRSLEKSVVSRFVSIDTNINNLQNKINQYYADVQSSDFNQYSESNESEASNRSRKSNNSTSFSSGSFNSLLEENRNLFKRIISNESEALNQLHESSNSTPSSSSSNSSLNENRNCFKRVFNLKKESIVKSFYYGKEDPKFSIVVSIMRWVESKAVANSVNNNNNNNVSSANNNNKNNME
ncbi:hypothetical protein C1645_815508 [Glomus cerebriforme]|uniref:Uncharacterized protein n=1 Tax=Glomus cerebriforme TaxID=658196 RepID=A0A397TMS2_9GLOM|nr:hypothetical protein C1645_815508 [Glomus cerebriforme]